MEKNKIKSQLKFMKKQLFNFTYNYEIIDHRDKNWLNEKKKLRYQNLIYSCDIGLSTVMIDRKLKSSKVSQYENKRRLCIMVKTFTKI